MMDGMSHCSTTAMQSSSGRPGRDAKGRGAPGSSLAVPIWDLYSRLETGVLSEEDGS